MFVCKACGKKFKTKDALGGHVSMAHPRDKAKDSANAISMVIPGSSEGKVAEVESEKPSQVQPAPQSQDEPGIMDRIRALVRQKYTPKQIKEQFGYAPRTVDDVAREFIKPEGLPEEKEEEESGLLPVILKDGKGEVISPEAVYQRFVAADGVDGARDFNALMRWAASIELVRRMTQIKKEDGEALAEIVKPVLDMMEKSREEMDAAAARARESTMQIAEVAAASAAARATAHIDQRFNELKQQKADIATVQDPMKGLMARTMETMMNRLQAMLLGGGQQIDLGPGFIDKRQGGK